MVHDSMIANKPAARTSKARIHILDTAQRIVSAKGFSSVGLSEILVAANVPKGSFYYYFESKEAFGTALLEHYFEGYLAEIEEFLSAPGRSARARLAAYWAFWREHQEGQDPDGKCLAVKLGAEVSDLSEEMRLALKNGTTAIVSRLARAIKEGKADGSISIGGSPMTIADQLYELWMGASVMSKISHDRRSFNVALAATNQILSGTAL